eukprot:g724.t1
MNIITRRTAHNVRGIYIYRLQFCSVPIGSSYTEQQARRLAEQMTDENVESEYMERLRGEVKSADSLMAGLEHELKSEIAQALKGSEDKVNWALLQCDLIEKKNEPTAENIKNHEYWRKEADTRRRNLIIHRQACGFRINNYSFVQKLYPIPPKWPNSNNPVDKSINQHTTKKDEPLSWEEKMRLFYAKRR